MTPSSPRRPEGRISYKGNSLDLLMVSHETEMSRHCPDTLSSGKFGSFDDDPTKGTTPRYVRIDRLGELHKIGFGKRRRWPDEQMEFSTSSV